jgi:Raf kinase inhibitor-like YbhB/YbcL family protein
MNRAASLCVPAATALTAWALVLFATGAGPAGPEGDAAMTLRLTSSSFEHEQEIPARHTCEGGDRSPPLAWSGMPDGTKSLALVVDDPDAPDPRAPKMTWVHWVLYDIPPSASSLPENASADKKLPPGASEGLNDWKTLGYRGPCPPVGRHRYFFKLYALDTVVTDKAQLDKPQLERAMKGHILAQSTLIGTYAKK